MFKIAFIDIHLISIIDGHYSLFIILIMHILDMISELQSAIIFRLFILADDSAYHDFYRIFL